MRERPNIQGHCTREVLSQFDRMLLFHAYDRDFAFVDTGDGPLEVMLLLVVSEEEYDAFRQVFKPTPVH